MNSRLYTALAAMAVLSMSAAGDATRVWDGSPFSGDPKALLAAASVVQPLDAAEEVVVLLDEAHYSFDEKGIATLKERLVFRVVAESGVENWSTIEIPWSPWYHERPEIEARVVTAQGTVHQLDPKSFGLSDAEDETDIFSDARVLSGPLPAMAVGSVVEQVVTYREKHQIYESGIAHRYVFGRGVGTKQARLTLVHPAGLKLHLSNRTAPQIAPRRSEHNGIVTVVFEQHDIPAKEHYEWNLPTDETNRGYVAFSTGKSWQDVATRYAAIIDRQIAAGAPPKETFPTSDVRAIAARILDEISRSIRYAGVEFGEGSIVPRAPAETLRNKYGDCKDKAVLLIARLRQAGIPAHAALLVSGNGLDIDPALPGLGFFDHVIAVIPGDRPLWIDPTDEFARVGELPDSDQDRLALIAAPTTTALTRTPVASAAENLWRETREFVLAEDGKATVIETTEYHGSEERSVRRHYALTDAKSLRESFESYVKDAYLAEALGKFEYSDPHDLSKPFRTRAEILKATRGTTAGGESMVGIFGSRMLSDLPWPLQQAEDEDESEEKKKAKARVHDFVFPRAYTFEIRHRITPPPGYVLRELPASGSERVGTATLTREYGLCDGSNCPKGDVFVNYRMDSGPKRISAADFTSMREAVVEKLQEPAYLLAFDQLGRQYLEAGDVGKAIAEFRRLAALHPKEALHRTEVARAFLSGGIGSAAREEARQAIAIEPGSARAHQALGFVLSHDLIGRQFGKGFDHEGAIAAYRKAKSLAPKDVDIRAEYASVLQWSPTGEVYGPGSKLQEAIDEYRSMKKELEVQEEVIDRELMVLYARTGQFEELKKVVDTTKDTEKKDIFKIVIAAALRGPSAGLKASEAIEMSRRRSTQQAAGGVLAVLRKYPEAAELLNAAALGGSNAAQIRLQTDLMRKTRRIEDIASTPDDPVVPLRGLMVAILADADEKTAARFLSTDLVSLYDDEELDRNLRRIEGSVGAIKKQIRREGTRFFLTDFAIASLQVQQEGNEEIGYRLLGRGTGTRAADTTTFVRREGGEYRIAAVSAVPQTIGLPALRLAQSGNLAGARQWLDWAREHVTARNGEDPLEGPAFAALWTKGKAGSADEILVAAASLLIHTKKSAQLAIEVLTKHGPAISAEQQARIDQALLTAYSTAQDWTRVLTVADRLIEKFPASPTPYLSRSYALMRLGRASEAEKLAQERLAKYPGESRTLEVLSEIASWRGDHKMAYDYLSQVLDRPDAKAADFNNRAWSGVFVEDLHEKAIEDARHAVALAPEAASILHTLATLYAESGRTAEARDTLLKSMDVSGTEEPSSHDWYVLGRIAENYGISPAAIAAYQRVEKPAAGLEFGSTWELAQKGLSRLKAATRPATKGNSKATASVSPR